jgi:hypothetical protein
MDDDVARLDARARRVSFASAMVILAGFVYFFVLIAVLNTVRTPLPGWIAVVMLPLVAVIIAIPVLRVVHASLVIEAARAQVRATERAIDEFERAKDDVAREDRLRED